MMGFRTSFFLFFAAAAAAVLFPFNAAAPDASGGLGLAVSLSCCEPFMVVLGPASSGGGASGKQCGPWALVGTGRGRGRERGCRVALGSRRRWSRKEVDKGKLAPSLPQLSGVSFRGRRCLS